MPGSKDEKVLYCSFCGKSQHNVGKLIAGPSVFICNECVALCNNIIEAEGMENINPLAQIKECLYSLCSALKIAQQSKDLILGREYSCIDFDVDHPEYQAEWQTLYSMEMQRLENSNERTPETVDWSERLSPQIDEWAKQSYELKNRLKDTRDDGGILYDMLRHLTLVLDGLPTAALEANDIVASNVLEENHRFSVLGYHLRAADISSSKIRNLHHSLYLLNR